MSVCEVTSDGAVMMDRQCVVGVMYDGGVVSDVEVIGMDVVIGLDH